MKHSERADEGVLYVDHRDSPGLDDAALAAIAKAFPGEDTLPPGAGKGLYEAPILTCGHNQELIIVNPKRNRRREKCPNCRRYICDKCAGYMKAGAPCMPIAKVIDDVLQKAYKEQQWKEIVDG